MAAVKIPATIDWKVAAVAVVGILVAYRMLTRDAVAVAESVGAGAVTAVKAVGTAVNPLDRDNVANKTTAAVVKATVGQTSGATSLGQQIFAWTNPDEWAVLKRHLTAN